MNCVECGRQIPGESKYCQYCGRNIAGQPRRTIEREQRGKDIQTVATVIVVVAVVVVASYAMIVILKDDYHLDESDRALLFEVKDLPGGFYQIWDDAFVSVYSGERTVEGNLVSYPIYGGWRPNSTLLTGIAPSVADFGARDIGGSWFNLAITDIRGDGYIGDGDHLRIYSLNGTFLDDTTYYMKFGASAYGGIAPFYIVFGFEFSEGDFDSWVEWGPNETAL
jgi:hypothetical protein